MVWYDIIIQANRSFTCSLARSFTQVRGCYMQQMILLLAIESESNVLAKWKKKLQKPSKKNSNIYFGKFERFKLKWYFQFLRSKSFWTSIARILLVWLCNFHFGCVLLCVRLCFFGVKLAITPFAHPTTVWFFSPVLEKIQRTKQYAGIFETVC